MLDVHTHPGCVLRDVFPGAALCETCEVFIVGPQALGDYLRYVGKWDNDHERWYSLGGAVAGLIGAYEQETGHTPAGVLFVGEGTPNA